jgi:hypothetical protein
MAISYKEAALRQQSDGVRLLGEGRLGTADHLFGVAAECALKAILQGLGVLTITNDAPQKQYKKHVPDILDEYDTIANGRAELCPKNIFRTHGWRIDHRYEQDATFCASRVEAHRGDAEAVMRMLEKAIANGTVK